MKKLILLFCALGMAVSSWAYDFSSNGIYYNITSSTNKTVAVTYSNTSTGSYSGAVTIPSSVINGGTSYSVTAIGDSAMMSSTLNSIYIPTSVTSIGKCAFLYCWNLSSLTIPNSVTTIAYGAFECCPVLETITIPASVTSIGSLAFFNCYILTNITVDASNQNFSSADGVLFNKTQTELIACPEGKVGTYTVPSTVTTIGNEAFMGNTNLTSIGLPSALTYIGDSAFSGCTKLTTISLPDKLAYIGSEAFSFCRGLTTITIPASVTYIGSDAFNCGNLSNIYASNATPVDISSSTYVFYSVDKTTCVLHVPAGSKSLYQKANQWGDFTNIVENTTGLYSASDCLSRVWMNNGGLVIEGLNLGTSISVYSQQGATIYTGKTTNSSINIALPQHGVYIVRVGGQSVKVIY